MRVAYDTADVAALGGAIAFALLVGATGAAPAIDAPTGSAATFRVSEPRSHVRIHVGKAGLLSMLGHGHAITAPVSGSITADPGRVETSSVNLAFATPRFHVLPEGEPEGDAPKVEEVMRGPRVLDTQRFAEIRFASRRVTGRAAPGATGSRREYELQVSGDVTIHGVTRAVELPMKATLEGDTLSATGRTTVRQDQFGITPVAAGGGTVRARNEVEVEFEIVAERRP